MASGPSEKTLSTGWSGKSSRTLRKSPAAVERPTDTNDTAIRVQPSELLKNLHLHQIELEIQNEELRRTQADLEASRARYFELYDLAPVGYVTIDKQGIILETNLRATTMLGTARAAWNGRNLKFSIIAEDQDVYYLSHKRLLKTGVPQVLELRMYRQGNPFWVRVEMSLGRTCDFGVSLIVIVDINDRKIAELQLQESHRQLECSLAEKRILAREVQTS